MVNSYENLLGMYSDSDWRGSGKTKKKNFDGLQKKITELTLNYSLLP